MTPYLELLAQHEQEARAAHLTEYRTLLKKHGDGTMTTADAGRLTTIGKLLGWSVKQIDDHTKLSGRRAALLPIAAGLRATWAAAQLGEIDSVHWEVLGLPDPAVAAKRRHLVQAVFGRPRAGAIDSAEFEAVMASPQNFLNMLDSATSQIEWLPAEGQTAGQLSELLTRARELARVGRECRYLLGEENAGKVAHYSNVCLWFDAVRREHPDHIKQMLSSYTFLPHPGQSREDLDAMLAKLRKKIPAEPKYGPNDIAWETRVDGSRRSVEALPGGTI